MCSDRLYADVHYVLSVMCPRMNDSYIVLRSIRSDVQIPFHAVHSDD